MTIVFTSLSPLTEGPGLGSGVQGKLYKSCNQLGPNVECGADTIVKRGEVLRMFLIQR